MAPHRTIYSTDEISRVLTKFCIESVALPPAVLSNLPSTEFSSLKTVIVGGEAFPSDSLRPWLENRNLFNAYGPTETTVCATIAELDEGTPSIGRPIANTQVYVLDTRLEPVPVGVAGELYIGGAGLARGYLNRPALTAERFIADRFSSHPGQRLYRTGDRARWNSDGNLEFLGRIDQQVKIRGYRIEPGEIQAVLEQQTSVRQAAVIAREDQSGQKRLVAYVVADSNASLDAGQLRSYLQEKLPEYMIPSAFVLLDKLPLTVNGKLDRKALPEPESSSSDDSGGYIAPRTPVEELLAGIWAEVLGCPRISVNDNFFALGGDSLVATRLISQIRKRLNVAVEIRTLFQAGTLEEFVRLFVAPAG
jgi:acyl-CoA synthetase (AMP-forming)/AMP-acid ligase II/acyl carrier protein